MTVAVLLAVVGPTTTRLLQVGKAATPPALWGTHVRLARVTFDPADGAPSPPGPLAGVAAAAGRAGLTDRNDLWLVQLQAPVTRTAQVALAAVALQPLVVVPEDTYLMRGTAVASAVAARLPGVRAVTAFPGWAKLGQGVESAHAGDQLELALFPDARADDVAARLRAAGVALAPFTGAPRVLLALAGGPEGLGVIAGDAGVAAVGVRAHPSPMNAIARWVTQSVQPGVTPLTSHGLLGQGEVAGVVDTGLDYVPDKNGAANQLFSDCTDPAHPTVGSCKVADFTYQAPNTSAGGSGCDGSGDVLDGPYVHPATNHRKVLAYFNLVARCAAVPGDSGGSTHGDHVSGSVAGDAPPFGVANGDDGMAPAAKLVFQDVGDDDESLAGVPSDYFTLLSQAYEPGRVPSATRGSSGPATPAGTVGPYVRGTGARVHSASIGSAIPVVGIGEAARIDDFVTNNEDMTVVVAAGNSGPDMATIGEPGTSKDVITSGAMANGFDDFASLDTMANFSSHGAALDVGLAPSLHRIKPDVVDPGLRIVSAKGGTSTEYQVLQGTSMSTPVLSGNALLVRQYLEDGFGPTGPQGAVSGYASGHRGATAGFDPSAALVKALLVSSGQRMRGQYTGAQGSQAALDGQWPSPGQGWGRVELDKALHFDDISASPDLWLSDVEFCPPPQHCAGATGHGVATGDNATSTIDVAAGQPLKVVLAWSDPGGLSSFLGAGPEEVDTNQLALQVDGPDGTSYCGNNINTMTQPSAAVATSMPGACNPLTDDKFNDVHGVYLPNPTPGRYTIHVLGDAVLQDQNAIGLTIPPGGGRQGYALAATGRFSPVPASVAAASPPPAVTAATVSAPSNDLAVVSVSTNVPTTAAVTLTPDGGAPVTLTDVYSRSASSYTGLALTLVENGGQFLDVPAQGTQHVVKFTGLSPGTHYTVRYTVTPVAAGVIPQPGTAPPPTPTGPPVSGTTSITTPTDVLAPTVGADTATLYNANSDAGPPVPDVNDPTWGASSQLYLGTLTSTGDIVCRVANVQACPPIQAGSAFKFRLPTGFSAQNVTGAVVLLTTRHDLASRVLATPTHQLSLLTDAAESTWGPGTTYQQIYGDAVQARLGAPSSYRSVVYDTEAFTVSCNDLAKLADNLKDGQAAFRLDNGGDPGTTTGGGKIGESLYAWESGFGRRTSGLEYRPRLVFFTGAGDPLGQVAPQAATVSDVRVERLDPTTAVVHWRTDQPANSLVLAREGTSADVVQVGSPAFVTEHHVTLDNVAAGTGWQFVLRSSTPDGRVTTATNGGNGWAVTDAATAPPGPALAATGAAAFPLPPSTDAPAAANDLAHGTGLACKAIPVVEAGVGGRPAAGPAQSPATGPIHPVLPEVGAALLVLALVGSGVRRRSSR